MGCSFSKVHSIHCKKCNVKFKPQNHLPICDCCFVKLPKEEKMEYLNSVKFLNKDFDEI